MTPPLPAALPAALPSLEAAERQFLAEVAAESIGWQPLGEGAYLHVGPQEEELVITVVGIPDAAMAGMHVLWLG